MPSASLKKRSSDEPLIKVIPFISLRAASSINVVRDTFIVLNGEVDDNE